MAKKVLFLTDLSFMGSGYLYLSVPLCLGLVEKGYEVKAIGLGNDGSEHNFPFSIIPARSIKIAHAIAHNLHFLWKPDILVVALDIPLQQTLLDKLKQLEMKYIAITPLENGPLTMSWAAPLMQADGVFFISKLGTDEAKKAGLDAHHLRIGIDVDSWQVPDEETRTRMRKSQEVEDKFVVLTVADNQERKNLWAAMDIISKAKKKGIDNLKYILVTREHCPVGHKLRDLAVQLGINNELLIMERGLTHDVLWSLYAMADLFLLTSKAEGLGLPILEAMASGLPVMATDTGAITELLEYERGFLIPPEYEFIDVWGNSKRSMISREKASDILVKMAKGEQPLDSRKEKALAYIKTLIWDIPVNQLYEKIEDIVNEQNKEQENK